ncbi:coiled-coil domain-containing protein 166 [Apteryx mantelli]|uniref:Coiled-coil domain-containing protein 166 n=1 Tax=Apteryx mantelli TaxID=2696672 RepID=A0A8B7IA24_9AVES|nr:PREDICTED: coiled-coil domain-containing protein 166-like [Apteryx mantelli mantelli]XP_013795040.1 PREDICTED: coiled-coil domain-containing protein 166-like [Apteryx mantelli mantelli]XP_025946631.1 coiled-coil domain-containing protein 166 [Apteryx rowi]
MTSKKKKLKQDTIRTGTNKEGLGTKNGEISKGRSPMETLVRERKQYLQEEYKTLTEHMNTYMGRVEHFLHENDILEKEAQQNQEESNAYLSYITKYSQKCQNVIITLNDQNHTDLSQIWKQKEKLISQYTEKEKEVRNYLMDMEKKYSLMNKEVEDLQPFKDLQLEQMNKIKDLEKELLVTKIRHSEQMHKIKSRFLQAKAACEAESHQKIQVLTKKAEEAAVQSLIQHAKQIKAENWHLRQELLNLIQCSRTLKAIRLQLREQQQQLLQENQYSQDMARMRRWFPQHEVHDANR